MTESVGMKKGQILKKQQTHPQKSWDQVDCDTAAPTTATIV